MGEPLGIQRLQRFLARASAGEELVVAFFGGSITQGSLASDETLCYAYRVYDLLTERYPRARFHYVNAGIGGTGSYFGAIRLAEDLLVHRPDLVVIDFSVNDARSVLPLYTTVGGEAASPEGAPEASVQADAVSPDPSLTVSCEETFEAVLRGILSYETSPAIIVLNNAFYDTGESVEDAHNVVADHYGIPHVSVRDRILPRIRAGEFTREDVSPDGLHPNDRGHDLIAREILDLIAQMQAVTPDEGSAPDVSAKAATDGTSASDCPTPGSDMYSLPQPFTANTYEGIRRRNRTSCSPQLNGFAAHTDPPRDRYDFFTNGWNASQIGDRMTLTLTGENLAVVYRRTIQRPAPVARLILDGDTKNAVLLDGNFDQDWGDCLYLQPILHHGAPGEHQVEVEIVQATKQDRNTFYLIAFGAC